MGGRLVQQDLRKTREDVALKDRQFVIAVFCQPFFFGALDGQRALVLVDAMPIEHAHFHDRARDARVTAQAGVAHVTPSLKMA